MDLLPEMGSKDLDKRDFESWDLSVLEKLDRNFSIDKKVITHHKHSSQV